jgi:hypothetical protein
MRGKASKRGRSLKAGYKSVEAVNVRATMPEAIGGMADQSEPSLCDGRNIPVPDIGRSTVDYPTWVPDRVCYMEQNGRFPRAEFGRK